MDQDQKQDFTPVCLTVDPECVIKPFIGFCVVRQAEAKSKVGNIIIPNKSQRRPHSGKVVRVGDPEHVELLGKTVVFPHMSGIPLQIKGQSGYVVFRYEELIAVIDTVEKVEFESEDTSGMFDYQNR